MEHNIKIEGKVQFVFPDLVKAAEIFAGAFAKKVEIGETLQHSIAKETPVKEEFPKEENTKNEIDTGDTPVIKQLHYGQNKDGAVYTKWQDMCKALDKAGPEKAPLILKRYSENGTYGGVKPADWDKVIHECTETEQGQEKNTTEPIEATEAYTMEDVRAVARKVQLSKGKDALANVFKKLNKARLSEFKKSEYAILMDALKAVE